MPEVWLGEQVPFMEIAVLPLPAKGHLSPVFASTAICPDTTLCYYRTMLFAALLLLLLLLLLLHVAAVDATASGCCCIHLLLYVAAVALAACESCCLSWCCAHVFTSAHKARRAQTLLQVMSSSADSLVPTYNGLVRKVRIGWPAAAYWCTVSCSHVDNVCHVHVQNMASQGDTATPSFLVLVVFGRRCSMASSSGSLLSTK